MSSRIIRPATMSRRGFLRNVLGVTAAIIVPTTQVIVPNTKELLEKFFMEKLDAGKAISAVNDWVRKRMLEERFQLRMFLMPDPILNIRLPGE